MKLLNIIKKKLERIKELLTTDKCEACNNRVKVHGSFLNTFKESKYCLDCRKFAIRKPKKFPVLDNWW